MFSALKSCRVSALATHSCCQQSLLCTTQVSRQFTTPSTQGQGSAAGGGGGFFRQQTPEEKELQDDIQYAANRHWDIHGPRKADRMKDSGGQIQDPLAEFMRSAKSRSEDSGVQVSDADIKATMNEWYLRKVEENKWNHFVNEMISTRLSRPSDWQTSDPLPDWQPLHMTATDPLVTESGGRGGGGRVLPNGDPTFSGADLGDFEIEYARNVADEMNRDNLVPYLPAQLRQLSKRKHYGWQRRASQLREFFEDMPTALQFHLDSSELPWIPDFYYDAHPPLPAFRNHEALTTIDPRKTTSIAEGRNLESEKSMLLKHGLKPWKRQQDATGVAYTPDFDFDLWSEDMNRPQSPTNTYGYVPNGQRVKPVIYRKQLPQRKRRYVKQFAPAKEPLVEFRWYSAVTHNQYQPSKKPRYTVLKIKGNGRGCAGIGFGQGTSYLEAMKKADAIANSTMIYVPRYMNHTIGHTLYAKHHRLRCYIEPRPLGWGQRGPPLLKAICMAFGIRDFSARFVAKNKNVSKVTKIKAVWKCFMRATNPETDCQDRGQRLVEAFPEVDGYSYQLPRGWAHDSRQKAIKLLESHQQMYETEERFSQFDLTENDRKSLPVWLRDEPNAFWEGGMPDIRGYQWRPDLVDVLNQKGPGGVPKDAEARIQKLLAEKIDPCDHHFRWMKSTLKVGPDQALGF